MNHKLFGVESKSSRVLFVAAMLTAVILAVGAPAMAQKHPSTDFDSNTPIDVVHVQGKIYMIVIGGRDGVNITAQVGDEGILLVDSGPAGVSDKLLKTIREAFGNKNIQYIVNTSADPDHIGGNANIAKALGRDDTGVHFFRVKNEEMGLRIVSGLKAQQRMAGALLKEDEVSPEAWPVSAFANDRKELFFNGEPVILYSIPNAHTDGDIIVFFRGSDVVSTGDAFVLGNYPVIDKKRGGTLEGVINALVAIEDLTVAEYNSFGGTKVIPGHGELSAEVEVLDSEFMLAIIRDRVQEMVKKGMTLQQVKAAKPTLEYDEVYGGKRPFWTPDMFLGALYQEYSDPARVSKTSSSTAGLAGSK